MNLNWRYDINSVFETYFTIVQNGQIIIIRRDNYLKSTLFIIYLESW